MLRIFMPVTIQRLWPGFNPQTWEPEASMLTTRPPKPSSLWKDCRIALQVTPPRNISSALDPITADAVLTPYIISTFLDMLISPTARHLSCSVLYLLLAETITSVSQQWVHQTIKYMCISSNTTIYKVVCYLLYVKHNYMFRPQMLAIFRLYSENLSIRYTCICRGCIGCGGQV